jgi:cytochrome P450
VDAAPLSTSEAMAMTIPRIEDLADPDFDPFLADEVMFGDHADPYPQIAELRAQGPVVPGEYRAAMGLPPEPIDPTKPRFTVLSYEAVEEVLSHPDVYSNRSFDPTLGAVFGPILSVLDPPAHTRDRKILQRAFRPQIVQAWGHAYVVPVIDGLIGTFRAGRRAELVEQFARPLPFQVIYRMLGLPAADVDTFYRLTIAQLVTSLSMDDATEAAEKLGTYFRALVERRRVDPGEDIVSALVTAEDEEGRTLSTEGMVSFLRQLMSAGGETTFRTLSILLYGLLSHRDQLEAVRGDRSLVPAAVEEALRWDGPVVSTTRETTRDTVLAGVALPAGAHIDVCLGSANHDPAVFERPEEFDVRRPRHRHLGFAFGIHNCIGQQLARLEMVSALDALLDELPDLRLDPDAPAPQVRGAMMRIPTGLPVVFGG